MKRNLKALLLAVMAVGALSAIGASAAQATEFDCDTANCTISSVKDGTGTTAHHVFDAPSNGPITCNEGKFSATGQPQESTSLTVTASYPTNDANGFKNCTFLGQPATVEMTRCKFTFTAHGAVNITGCMGDEIHFAIAGCTATIKEQNLTGITDSADAETVTVSAKVEKIHVVMVGAACVTQGTFTTGTYTTGNTIITGATAGGTMVNVDWDTATSD